MREPRRRSLAEHCEPRGCAPKRRFFSRDVDIGTAARPHRDALRSARPASEETRSRLSRSSPARVHHPQGASRAPWPAPRPRARPRRSRVPALRAYAPIAACVACFQSTDDNQPFAVCDHCDGRTHYACLGLPEDQQLRGQFWDCASCAARRDSGPSRQARLRPPPAGLRTLAQSGAKTRSRFLHETTTSDLSRLALAAPQDASGDNARVAASNAIPAC